MWPSTVVPQNCTISLQIYKLLIAIAGGGDIQSNAMPFPQPWSLSGALQESQLCLLGKVLGVCAPAEQVRMLDGLRTSVIGKAGKQRERGDPQQLQQHGVAIRASIAALSGLQSLVDRYKGAIKAVLLSAPRILQCTRQWNS